MAELKCKNCAYLDYHYQMKKGSNKCYACMNPYKEWKTPYSPFKAPSSKACDYFVPVVLKDTIKY